uniref:J domain-containing protein n=1 Tax=Strigamia maritima TaxID=126957 RepID=T1IL79_STRMM
MKTDCCKRSDHLRKKGPSNILKMSHVHNESGDEESLELDEDYYTFLNVRREATGDEINNAYRRQSRLYHPDKHSDPIKKKQAENLFSKTKKAYEVLNDPHKRAIYDNLGTKGLETEGWEIVQRTKTAQEIRDEYERLAREREERQLQQRTNPKGSITTNINASELFDVDDTIKYDTRAMPTLEVSGINISQSIEAPLTVNDTISLSGLVQTHNGTGNGVVNCSVRRILSTKSWAEFELGAGNGLTCTARAYRTLSKRCFGNVAGTFQFTPLGLRPGLQVLVGHQLDKHVTGYLTWRAGLQSSMNTTVVWDTAGHHLAFSVQFGLPNTFLMASYARKVSEEFKIKGSVKAGTFGVLVEYGCEKKISRHSVVGASMIVGTPAGVNLKIKVMRGNQNYIFPILLSDQLLPTPILYGTITPILLYFVAQKLIITPFLEAQKKKEKDKQKEANALRMSEKKKEAEAAVSLMQETVARIREQEDMKKGLIIVSAVYGKITLDSTQKPEYQNSEAIDVTIALQCLVKDSKLILYETSKAQLPGFYDPCVGEDKSLYVHYLFHNLLHEITVGDNEMIRIPKQCK